MDLAICAFCLLYETFFASIRTLKFFVSFFLKFQIQAKKVPYKKYLVFNAKAISQLKKI